MTGPAFGTEEFASSRGSSPSPSSSSGSRGRMETWLPAPGPSCWNMSIAPVVLSRMTRLDSRAPWGHKNSLYTLKAFSFLAAWD